MNIILLMKRCLFFGLIFWCGGVLKTLNSLGQSSNFVTYGIEEGLIQSQVQALTQDNQGNLWIGTLGGLTKYDGKSFTGYTEKDGLAEDWIAVSHKDKHGNIWFGHWGGGVSIYLYEDAKFLDLQFEKYSKYQQITAITEDKTGNIWFGTEGAGIIKYDPGSNKIITIDEGLSSNYISSLYADNYGKLWIGTDNGITI